ncbi:hypothetical protein BGW39_008505 [Mortierella sp. 14UC]|nr:hypothetical protein BGW39_008505 [Mortierella sp. 14UC]
MESVLEQPAAHLQSSTRTLDQTSLHLLPCGIQHDGKANIPGFFLLVDGQYKATAAPPTANSTTTSTTTTTGSMISEQVTDGNSVAITSSETVTTTSVSKPAGSGSVPPEVSFRGRTLKGAVMTIPEGYIGTIYTPSELAGGGGAHGNGNGHSHAKASQEDMDMDDDQEYEAMLREMREERKVMRTEAQFKEWMFWGHDDQPTARTDKVVRAMQWIDIAGVLHEPILC